MTLSDEALELMLYQFRNSTKLKGLICSLLQPLQTIADEIESLKDGRYIHNAVGHQLDILGQLVFQTRLGMGDEDFRLWIKARIRLNRSQGTGEDIIKILQILLGDDFKFAIDEYFPSIIVFTFFNALKVPQNTLFDVIKAALPLGSISHFVRADNAPAFQFGTSSFSQSYLAEFY